MDNDISPDGYSSPLLPITPPKQVQAAEVERDETLSQLPLLKMVLKRLDKRIAETDSVKTTLLLADKFKLSREQALVLQNILNQQLEVERSFIETRIKRAKP